MSRADEFIRSNLSVAEVEGLRTDLRAAEASRDAALERLAVAERLLLAEENCHRATANDLREHADNGDDAYAGWSVRTAASHDLSADHLRAARSFLQGAKT